MAKKRSLRNKAVHLISELTTVLLNPISDKPSHTPSSSRENEDGVEKTQMESKSEEDECYTASMAEPDTSSFAAFLYSLLRDDYFAAEIEDEDHDKPEAIATESLNLVRESNGKRGLLYRGKQSFGKAMTYAARLTGLRNQALDKKSESASNVDDKKECQDDGRESRVEKSNNNEGLLSLDDLPDLSEPSMLLTKNTRIKIHGSLPTLVRGRKWVLLYSTWKHGISLSTLYRRSMQCPGLSLLVVGDQKGAVFGGLVEAPLQPCKSRRYQGTNSTFVFSDVPGQPAIYHPTGANRYYTLCSPDFLAFGGGPHFALYLDADLLSGSSGASETYGNPCLACSESFKIKEVELWGFVNGSRYAEMLAIGQNEAPGVCRW